MNAVWVPLGSFPTEMSAPRPLDLEPDAVMDLTRDAPIFVVPGNPMAAPTERPTERFFLLYRDDRLAGASHDGNPNGMTHFTVATPHEVGHFRRSNREAATLLVPMSEEWRAFIDRNRLVAFAIEGSTLSRLWFGMYLQVRDRIRAQQGPSVASYFRREPAMNGGKGARRAGHP